MIESDHAIVFDLDDTLYAERDYAFSGFAAVAAAFEARLGPAREVAARLRSLFDTADRGHIFNALLAERGLNESADLISKMITTYRTHTPAIHLHTDADAFLQNHRAGHKLGLITDGYAESQNRKIVALGLERRVDHTIVTDDWGRAYWKPHPRAFKTMAEQLDVPADRCVYIADNQAKDFVAPNVLGWHTVLIQRPDGIHTANPPAPGGKPDRIITTLNDL